MYTYQQLYAGNAEFYVQIQDEALAQHRQLGSYARPTLVSVLSEMVMVRADSL